MHMRFCKNVYFQIGCIQQISILFPFCEITPSQPSVLESYGIKIEYQGNWGYILR